MFRRLQEDYFDVLFIWRFFFSFNENGGKLLIFLEKDLEVAALGVKACLQQLQVAVESH